VLSGGDAMLKRFRFWLWLAVVFMFLSGAVHAVGLIVGLTGENEAERQLINLMHSVKFDLGAGFHPNMMNLFNALSSCYSLLCLFGGLVTLLMLKRNAAPEILRGIVLIDLLIFGVLFAVTLFLTFLLPIIAAGLIFVSVLAAFITLPRTASS
jgi:hypothetical protein